MVFHVRYWNNRFAVCFSAVSAAVCFFFFWEERSTFRQRRAIELGAAAFLLLCFLSPLWSAYPLAGLRVAVFYLAAAALGWSAALLFSNTAEETQILGKSIGERIRKPQANLFEVAAAAERRQ